MCTILQLRPFWPANKIFESYVYSKTVLEITFKRHYIKDMGLSSSQQIFQFLFLFRYMFRSFDHLQVGIHNTEKPSLTTVPAVIVQFV
jgi:hypothetical protein